MHSVFYGKSGVTILIFVAILMLTLISVGIYISDFFSFAWSLSSTNVFAYIIVWLFDKIISSINKNMITISFRNH
jgi:hypothetical protein